MNTKTFEAIDKLKEVELELHRLKNALEMANKSLDAQRTWVGLTGGEIDECFAITPDQYLPWQIYQRIEKRLKEKNT